MALASENDGDAQYKTIGFELLANGIVAGNFESTTIPEGTAFADYSISVDTAADPSVVGQNITVALVYNYTGPYNRAAYFDNVRLTQASDLSTTLTATTTALSINPPGSILDLGANYTLTAVVSAPGGDPIPTGNVVFNIGGVMQTVGVDGTGTARVTGSAATLGFVPIFAVYQGSTAYAPSQSGTLGETVIAGAPVQTQVNLTSSFNTNGIYTDGTSFSNGGVDGDGNAYSGTLLGSSLTIGQTLFDFGPANQTDVIKAGGGPTVPLPNYNFSTLAFLGTGFNGGQGSQPFTVNYSDGSSTTFSQGLSDWFATSGYFPGESIAETLAYRNGSNGQPNGGPLNLYVYSFSIDPTRAVTSITLPNDGNVAIFAITLLP